MGLLKHLYYSFIYSFLECHVSIFQEKLYSIHLLSATHNRFGDCFLSDIRVFDDLFVNV